MRRSALYGYFSASAPVRKIPSNAGLQNSPVSVTQRIIPEPRFHLLDSADTSPWEEAVATSDGLPIRESGSWIQQKHQPLTYYSEIFNQAMKDQPWLHHRVYLELFAGPGKCLIRESNREDFGSPLKVLEKNFTNFIFIEINEPAARALFQRLKGHPKASQVDIWCGDCAEAIRQIAIPNKSLTLAFVDPTRIGQAPFALIEVLSSRARCDLLINIPIGTDIKRNMHNYVRHTDAAAPLTVYSGCDSWKQLPKNSPAHFCRGLIQIYQTQLQQLGYSFVGNIQQVTTSKNLPLYYLLFASKSQLGEKFWNETLRRVNAPELF